MWAVRRVLGGAMLAMGTAASAAPVVPDRPGFSTGTATVAPGAVQFEGGVQRSREGGQVTWMVPLLNVRVGLDRRTELNLLWDGVQRTEGGNRDTAAAMVGLKRRLPAAGDVDLSLLAYLSAPEGRLAPFVGLLWARPLSGGVEAFGTVQVATTVTGGGYASRFQPAVGLAFSHGPAWGTFVEVYGDVPLGSGSATATVDAGVTWRPREDVQLDLNLGRSLDRRGENLVGVGVAVRY